MIHQCGIIPIQTPEKSGLRLTSVMGLGDHDSRMRRFLLLTLVSLLFLNGSAVAVTGSGTEDIPVPINFPLSQEARDVSYQYINFSDGAAAAEGSWASGPTPDGKGEFTYLDGPETTVPMPPPTQPDPRFYGTDAKPNSTDKAMGVVEDKLSDK